MVGVLTYEKMEIFGWSMDVDRENLGNQGFLYIIHSTKIQPFFKGILSITLRDFP
jgi:hypothetical protein